MRSSAFVIRCFTIALFFSHFPVHFVNLKKYGVFWGFPGTSHRFLIFAGPAGWHVQPLQRFGSHAHQFWGGTV